MKIWALERNKQKIKNQLIFEYPTPTAWTVDILSDLLTAPCQAMDMSRPVVLSKHVEEMERIGRVVFRRADFLETVLFDTFEVEALDQEKEKANSTQWA